MTLPPRWWVFPAILFSASIAICALVIVFAAVVRYPKLPGLDDLIAYNPKIPLRVYTADKVLIGEFGAERRNLVSIAAVPAQMRNAILAAEDERFYQHGGVDYVGVLRAAVSNVFSGGVSQGASTITMQVARNFYLSNERTFDRKFNEALLSFKIEHNLTKDQILELYINQINLGQRAYGFAAAAQIYFGKPLDKLSVAEMAMLAGLPKAPSRYNPVVNPKRAQQRQQYVLRRMRELNYITDAEWKAALEEPLKINRVTNEYAVHADYVAEMVRQSMYDRFQEKAYTEGFTVYTTLLSTNQETAYNAVRRGALDYDRRHGYRGAERYLDISADANEDALDDALQDEVENDGIFPAVVLEASPTAVKFYRKGGEIAEIQGDGLRVAQRMLGDKAPANQKLRRGALIRVDRDAKQNWEITQLPQIEAALVSLDPQDGAVRALIGGFDFNRNKYNHVTQAWRQPGSSFKPFIYSAALEKGFTPATVINDAPLTFDAAETGSEPWTPSNFDGTFDGPIRMRTALVKSKNLVSIRILQAITPQYAQDYITRFGFDADRHPPYLTMALGAGSVTPWQIAGAYAVFANGGYRITPYFITRVDDVHGKVVVQAQPVRAEETAPRVVDPRNVFIMNSMLQDVARVGTAAKLGELHRGDLAGKTGTTNDFVDAWFCGYGTGLVAVTWIGYDNPRTLGRNETGAVTALPIWSAYMGAVLKGVAEAPRPQPDGIVQARIDPATGLRVPEGGITEFFYQEYLPPEGGAAPVTPPQGAAAPPPPEDVRNQLF